MSENCKDCIQVQNLEDKIKALWHQVEESKEERKDFEKRITDLEISQGENKKDFNRLFDDVEEIKQSLREIAEAIKNINSTPGKNYEKLKWIVTTALVSMGIGAVLGYITTNLK